VTPTSIYLDLK